MISSCGFQINLQYIERGKRHLFFVAVITDIMDLDDFSGLKKKKKKKKKPFDMEGLEDALTVGFLILSKVNNIILRQVYHAKVGIILCMQA